MSNAGFQKINNIHWTSLGESIKPTKPWVKPRMDLHLALVSSYQIFRALPLGVSQSNQWKVKTIDFNQGTKTNNQNIEEIITFIGIRALVCTRALLHHSAPPFLYLLFFDLRHLWVAPDTTQPWWSHQWRQRRLCHHISSHHRRTAATGRSAANAGGKGGGNRPPPEMDGRETILSNFQGMC